MHRASRLFLSEAVLGVLLLLFVAAVWVSESVFGQLGAGKVTGPVAFVLVAFPAVVWLLFFYLQDRYEPEPTHYVVGVFLLGALVAAPLAYQVTDWLLADPGAPLGRFSGERLATVFLISATAQEAAKYLVVRYTVYLSAEFDEPMDGIVYLTAAGIGFAMADNLRYLAQLGGGLLTVGAIHVVLSTLAHASFAAVSGYALGRARFAARGSNGILSLGLLSAIALNGTFSLLCDVAFRRGLALRPWVGFIAAWLFALAVFGLVALLMRRQLRLSAPPPALPPGSAAAGGAAAGAAAGPVVGAAAMGGGQP